MSSHPNEPGPWAGVSAPAKFTPFEWLLLLLLFCVPPMIGMARHPLWIDEAQTLFPVATQGTSITEFIRNSLHLGGSLQVTPLYAMLVALWARVLPTTEFALRCVNLPFLVITALVARAFVGHLQYRSTAGRWLALAFVALGPFYVYYSFDLRPYASLISFGGMIALGLVWLAAWDARGPWLFSAGFGLSFLSQPTVVVVAPVLGLVVLLLARRDFSRSLRLWQGAWILGAVLAALAGTFYYLVRHGDGAQPFGGRPDLKNVVFVLFEFAGLSGLGPTREQLRMLAPPEGAESALQGSALLWTDWVPVALAGTLWLIGIAYLLRQAWQQRGAGSSRSAALTVNAAFFFGGLLSVAVFFYCFQYRFLPRHICFLYLPFVFLVLTLAAGGTAGGLGRILAALAVLGFAVSSGQLLLNPRYARDDFRSALDAWRQRRGSDPALRFWTLSYPPALLYYSGEATVLYVDESTLRVWERTGPASYRSTVLSPDRIGEVADAAVVCIRNPTAEIWSAILGAGRGRRVILGINRGTEFDPHGRARELLQNPASKAEKLPPVPFIESFQVLVP